MRRLLWIALALLTVALVVLVMRQDARSPSLIEYDSSSLTAKLVALVLVAMIVLTLFRQRFPHALESVLIWLVIASCCCSGTPTASSCATSASGCWPNSFRGAPPHEGARSRSRAGPAAASS